MSDYTSKPHELGWEDEISNDSGNHLLLEEGDYEFTVTGFERARFPGSAKIPPCGKAVLTLEVVTGQGAASVRYDLILFSTLEWKLSEFFRAIGQKKPGEALRPRWNELVGSRGRARFKPRAYINKNGEERQVNDVVRFYDYDPSMLCTGQAAVWSAERF